MSRDFWGNKLGRPLPVTKVFVSELATRLELVTCCLQDSCATDCATPARRLFPLVGDPQPLRMKSASGVHLLTSVHCVCHQVRGTIHGLLSDGTDHVSIHVARDRMLAYPTSSVLMPTTAIRELLEVCTTPPRTGHQEPSTLHTRCTHREFRPSYVAVTCRADKCSSIGSQSGAHCAPLDVRSKTPAT
jgi:hypothetical protein